MQNIFAWIAAALLTILGIAAAGTMGYSAYSSHKVTTVSADINLLVGQARGQMSQGANGYQNFSNANFTALNNAGVFPQDMVRAGGLYDSWGNPVTLGNASNNTQGTVQFGGGGSETTSQCSGVATTLKDYVSLVVGGQTFTQNDMPDTVSAGTACAGSPTITVTFQ
jgi:hypothetical protein